MNFNATLIELSENIGFGRACNKGAALSQGEFLFFLNPDTKIAPDTLNHLRAAAETYPEASAFNPTLQRDGRPAFKRRSVLLPKAQWAPRALAGKDTTVPMLSGAALFMRRAAFDTVGGFDPHIFLYHEDDDICLRLKKEVGPLRLVAKAHVEHLAGLSTKSSCATARLKAWYMGQSRAYSSRKHDVPHWKISTLRHALFQLFHPASLVSPRKRTKNWWFLRGVLYGMQQSTACTALPVSK